MLNPNAIVIDSTVSFDLYPAAYLQTKVTNAKVVGIVSARMAMQLGFDAPAMHVTVFPTLPPGTPNGYDKYQYIYVKLPSGEHTFYGIPWIKESTYTEEMVRTIALYLENISPEQQNRAVQALAGIGLTVAKTEVQS